MMARLGVRVLERLKYPIPGQSHESARALRALAVGGLAFGALAVGALAIGSLAVGALAIGKARFRRLDVGELVPLTFGSLHSSLLPERLLRRCSCGRPAAILGACKARCS